MPLLDAPPANAATLQTVWLVIGPNVWGRGYDEGQAIAAAGKPKKFISFQSTDPWVSVDGMGYIVSAHDSQVWEVRRHPKTLK